MSTVAEYQSEVLNLDKHVEVLEEELETREVALTSIQEIARKAILKMAAYHSVSIQNEMLSEAVTAIFKLTVTTENDGD